MPGWRTMPRVWAVALASCGPWTTYGFLAFADVVIVNSLVIITALLCDLSYSG
jgi:hypothetical protein